MKRYAWIAALALCLGNTAQAAVIDLEPAEPGQTAAPAQASSPVSDLAVTGRSGIVLPAPPMSELPEPEVFAMMLVGLILIGYRAGRDKSDKFK
ncbi:hypothetical protein [Massilia sp.]|uniref:hypothetical protein n=1 Tax=Massilia sp. TaxID=1882437 RepID=UPI00289EB3F2|nr:hypothetical protein [Massilia sp.]